MPIVTSIIPIDNAALTTKQVNGTGTFDVIMTSAGAHLIKEYESGRITGQEYAKAYVEITVGALGAAVQFLLQKDNAYWQGVKIEQDAKISEYNLNNILPAQLLLITEQTEAQRAQTKDTRLDGTTVEGSVGKQKDLYDQQITSYQRDAEVKAAKLFTDAWITQKTIDEGLTAPTGFTNASLDTILTKLKLNNALN